MSELQVALQGRVPAHVGLVTHCRKYNGHPCVVYYLRDYVRDEHVFLGREGIARSGQTTAELLAEIGAWRAAQ